jgi:hypothetical protein
MSAALSCVFPAARLHGNHFLPHQPAGSTAIIVLSHPGKTAAAILAPQPFGQTLAGLGEITDLLDFAAMRDLSLLPGAYLLLKRMPVRSIQCGLQVCLKFVPRSRRHTVGDVPVHRAKARRNAVASLKWA